MRRIEHWMALAVLALAMPAGAQTLDVSVDGGGGYDSNVFGGQNSTPSGVFTLGTHLTLFDDLERSKYRIGYSPTLRAYTREGGDETFNHNAFFTGSYQLTQRTQVSLEDDFAHVQNIQQDTESATANNQGDDTLIRNSTRFALNHRLTQRWSAAFNGTYDVFHYSSSDDEDSTFLSGRLSTAYQLDPKTSVGMGGVLGLRAFDPVRPVSSICAGRHRRPGTRSLNYQAYLSIQRQWDPKTQFSVRAGPAQIETANHELQQGALCPGVDPTDPNFNPNDFQNYDFRFDRKDRATFTWFAEASGSRRWKKVNANVFYRRSEGAGSSGSGSSVNDSVGGSVSWKIARLWNASLSVNWLQRNSTSGTQASGASGEIGSQDVETVTVSGKVGHQLGKRFRVALSASYLDQETSRKNTTNTTTPSSPTTGYDAFRLDLTFTYAFEPRIF